MSSRGTDASAAQVGASPIAEPGAVRARVMRELFDPGHGRGLEIGPLHQPVVARTAGDVWYVDVHDIEGLRASYQLHENFPLDLIEEPDFVLIGPEGVRTLPEAVAPAAPFDWVVASHVIEHVPDVVTWLAEVADVLVDDGVLALAVPDRRLCFDAARTPTTVGALLQAHDLRERIPSVRAVYDHFSQCMHADSRQIWTGQPAGPLMYSPQYAMEQVERARAGEYVDCHVWVWTAAALVEQLNELASLGLHDFVVEHVVDPEYGELEFFVRLRRLPRGLGPDEVAERRASGVGNWSDVPLPEPEVGPDQPVEFVARTLSEAEARLVLAKRRGLHTVRSWRHRPPRR